MMRAFLSLILFVLVSWPVLAADLTRPELIRPDLIRPAASHSPQEVVEIQLMGLQAEDTELGIEQVWLFAHPANKAMTGPLARFRTLFASPAYAPLLGHQAHAIRRMDETADNVRFVVRVLAQDGLSYAYLWQLQRVADGPQANHWMTVGVSAPRAGSAS
ncbi:MAG: hypothetical protein ISP42_00025 [Alphaproteobacteria bacterium]|jgi:hypothetical protein|nr:hypothetical protein [Alphaproteobacteria bacterium]